MLPKKHRIFYAAFLIPPFIMFGYPSLANMFNTEVLWDIPFFQELNQTGKEHQITEPGPPEYVPEHAIDPVHTPTASNTSTHINTSNLLKTDELDTGDLLRT
jgi:hypothetical protein